MPQGVFGTSGGLVAVKISVVDWRAAAGLACALPYLGCRTVVTEGMDPVLAVLRAGGDWAAEGPLLFVALAMLLAGAGLALQPVFAERRFPVLNLLVAGALLAAFAYAGFQTARVELGCTVLSLSWC